MPDAWANDWLVYAVALFPVVYFSTFIHELGHVLMGRWNGYVVTSFGMGVSKPFWVWNWRGTRVYFARARPFQGITFLFAPELYPTRGRHVSMLAGGILAQGLLMLVALALWWLVPWGRAVWLVALIVNAFGVIVNLLPFSIRIGRFASPSDGASILQLLRDGGPQTPAPAHVHAVQALHGLFESIGDDAGLHIYLVSAASDWIELGDIEQAEQLCTEAEALRPERWPVQQALGAMARGIVARAAGRFDDSAKAFDTADALFRPLNHAVGLFIVAWGRAELLLAQGNARDALQGLDALLAHPLLLRRSAFRLGLLVSRLCACAASSQEEGLEDLRAEYEHAPPRHRSPANDLRIYRTLGRCYAKQQDWIRAEAAYEQALTAARHLYEALSKPADRQRFLQCQTEMLAEASDCLRQAGKAEQADRIATRFPSSEELSRQRVVAEQERSSRQHRLGWIIVAANLLVGVVLAACLGDWDQGLSRAALSKIDERWGVGILLPVVGLVLVALYGLLYLVACRYIPAVRQHGGEVTLWFAVIPWGGWLVILLVA